VFGNHGLGGLLEEGAHGKSPKCLGGNLGDFAKVSVCNIKKRNSQNHSVSLFSDGFFKLIA